MAADAIYGELSLPALMAFMADYTRYIDVTNEMVADAFAFGLPQDLVLAEVRRMSDWLGAHRTEVETAVAEAKLKGEWA